MPALKPHSKTQLPPLKMIVVACVIATSGLAYAQSPLSLRTASSLDDSPDMIHADSASFITADSMETTDDEIVLRGNAEIRRAGTVIRGDEITYTQSTDTVDVEGNAVVIREGARFDGPKLSYQIETDSGEMQNVNYQYAARGIRGKTSSARFMNGVNTEFKKATLTTCKPGSKAWWIEADSLEVDETNHWATAHDVSFHLAGIPVMATPWAIFPTGTERQSGLLMPTLGMSSTRGVDISLPIYWNIAPNYDYTFTPRVMSKRGILLGNEFRFLTENVGGQITYDYMPDDKEANRSRYGSTVKTWAKWNGFHFRTDYNRVSDGRYVADFSSDIYSTSESVLPQDFYLTYGKDFWNSSISVQKNQVLQRDKDENGQYSDYAKPYEIVPQIDWKAYLADYYGFEISSTLEVARFTHPDKETKVQGDRLYMQHSIAYPLRGAGWFITPKTMLTGVQYSLSDMKDLNASLQNTYDESSRFAVPTFSLDTGLIFERDSAWFGREATQTLEPRVFYAYTPYRDQSRMPTFDSSYADLSFSSFFSENIFTGHDRVSEANQVSLILTSRYLDRKTGYEWLRASVGQRYYFQDQDVSLSTNNQVGTTKNSRSDFLGSVSANITKDVVANTSAQYSTSESRFTRVNAGLRWHPKPSAVMGLYYRYNIEPTAPEDKIKQIDFAVQWPITNKIYALGRYNYSLFDNQPVEMLGGVEYVADCWALRLVAQRYITASDKYDTSFFVQLELTGLGSVGSNPLEELRRNIPGYQAATAMPGQTGLYDYYE